MPAEVTTNEFESQFQCQESLNLSQNYFEAKLYILWFFFPLMLLRGILIKCSPNLHRIEINLPVPNAVPVLRPHHNITVCLRRTQ